MRRDYFEELQSILKSSLPDNEKKERILQYHENDIANVIEELSQEERKELFNILGDEIVAEIISYVENIDEVINDFKPEHAADIIEKMDADDAIDVLSELEDDQREEIVSLMDKESREDIKAIASFDEDLIGSRMTNNYITILVTDTVKTAMKKVISEAAENDNVSNIFVLDESETFYGVLELRELIIARENDSLIKKIKTSYPFFYATDYVEDCINKLREYGLDSYPILDNNNYLLGVITAEDVLEAVDDEMGDDYAKLAGLTQEEEKDDSVFESAKKRLPWLIVLLILGLLVSFSMTGFEKIVASIPLIAFFQTLILDMAGNTGTQSLAVTVRMLSLQENSRKSIFKAILKELKIGFINGLVLAIFSFILVFLFMLITQQGIKTDSFYAPDAVKAATIISISLLVAMSVSSFIGSLVPVIFLKIKIDPAVASGPFITTVNDVIALLIYYGFAYLLFLAF